MHNEMLIRNMISGSLRRAIQESVAAFIVLVAFASLLADSEVGSLKYYGCLVILVTTGFITGVVWSFALNYRLLQSHPAEDSTFWRAAFLSQARLLRWVPLWYCAPFAFGACLFVAPLLLAEPVPFLMVFGLIVAVFAAAIWLNRYAADLLDEAAGLLD